MRGGLGFILLVYLAFSLFACTIDSALIQSTCSTDENCPGDYVCAVNRCVPKQCDSDSDCNLDYKCTGNLCVPYLCSQDEKRCVEDQTGFVVCLEGGNGSTDWGEVQPCPTSSPMKCLENGICECDHQCADGTKSCNMTGNVASCLPDALGCRIWTETETCANSALKYCVQPNATQAACTCFNECEANTCFDPSTQQICGPKDGSDCKELKENAPCPKTELSECVYADGACQWKLFQANSENTLTTRQSGAFDAIAFNYGFVVVWLSAEISFYGGGGGVTLYDSTRKSKLYAKIYDSEGEAKDKTVADVEDAIVLYPSVFPLQSDHFGIVWQKYVFDYPSTAGTIFYGRYDDKGSLTGSQIELKSFTPNEIFGPSASSLGNGSKFVISWLEQIYNLEPGYNDNFIYTQVFKDTGTAEGSQFLVSSWTNNYGIDSIPTVIGLATGGFVVAWAVFDAWYDSREGLGLKVQCFGSAPYNSTGDPIIINSSTTYSISRLMLSALPDGNFGLGWQMGQPYGIIPDPTAKYYFRIYKNDCTPHSGQFWVLENTTTLQYSSPSILSLNDQQFILSWVQSEYLNNQLLADSYIQSLPVTYDGSSATPGSIYPVPNIFLQGPPAKMKGIGFDATQTLFIFNLFSRAMEFFLEPLNSVQTFQQIPGGIYAKLYDRP